MTEKYFWLDDYIGEARGGIFLRNGLGKFIKECEDKGYKIVAIRVDESYNLELLFKPKGDEPK